MTPPHARIGQWFFGQAYVLLALTALFWGGNIVIGRAFAAELPPATLSLIRWGGAFLLALLIARRRLVEDWPRIKAHAKSILVLGVTGIGLYNTMAYTGLRSTQALNALLLQSAGPILTGLWTFLIFRERPTLRQTSGIALSLAGVVTIITKGDWTALASLRLNEGDLWIMAAMAIYAFYAANLRNRPAIHWSSFLAVILFIGALCQLPLIAIERLAGLVPVFTPAGLAAITYIVVFPAFLAYIFFNRGVELVGANHAAPFFHLIPVFGSVLAIVFLGERPALYHAVGYALVLTGVFVATRR